MSINVKPLADRVIIEPAALKKKLLEELLFLTQLKKNLNKVKSLLLVTVKKMSL